MRLDKIIVCFFQTERLCSDTSRSMTLAITASIIVSNSLVAMQLLITRYMCYLQMCSTQNAIRSRPHLARNHIVARFYLGHRPLHQHRALSHCPLSALIRSFHQSKVVFHCCEHLYLSHTLESFLHRQNLPHDYSCLHLCGFSLNKDILDLLKFQ